MTEEIEIQFKKDIKDYLSLNNLSIFKTDLKNNFLKIEQMTIEDFIKKPSEYYCLINPDEIEYKNSAIIFNYQNISISYFKFYNHSMFSSDNKIFKKDDLEKYHISRENIVLAKEDNDVLSIFKRKKEKKIIEYLDGYVYKKGHGNDLFLLELKRKIITNNYYLTLNL